MGTGKLCQTKYSKEPRMHNTEAAQHLNVLFLKKKNCISLHKVSYLNSFAC